MKFTEEKIFELEKHEIQSLKMFRRYCEKNNIRFVRASKESDLKSGIDVWAGTIPTDVKNTNLIYVANYDIKQNKFFVRHPFKIKSKAKNYFFVKKELFVNIEEYLNEKFIKPGMLLQIKQILEKYDFTNFAEHKKNSIEHFLCSIKSEVGKLLQKRYSFVYYHNLDSIENRFTVVLEER